MKKIVNYIFLCVLLLIFISCGQKDSIDILTQKPISPDKIPITVLVKNAFSINTFEKEAEKVFPNINIIQVGNYTYDRGVAEYETRLKHNDIPDMVMHWPLEVGKQYWEENLIDLSTFPFSGRYNTSMLNAITKDGKLFYLPGPSQIRAIVYNKTLFKEHGWQVPSNFDEFIALCQKIENSGIRSLQLGFGNAEVLDTALVGFGYANSFSTPQSVQKLTDYTEKKMGSLGDFAKSALETYQVLINKGIFKETDLNVFYQDRESMLFTRECAMVEDSVLMARMGYGRTGITDEFALMPFFIPAADSDWVRIYPVCYIGANKKLTEPDNQEKYDAVLKLLDYISTPQGQIALVDDTGGMLSHLNGVQPFDISEIQDLLPALEGGRYGLFPTIGHAQDTLRAGLAGMLKGELTVNDVIKMTDRANSSPTVLQPPIILGSASADFNMIETGNFITDVMKIKSGCDIALFMDNGKDGRNSSKGVSAVLYEGEQTPTDIKRIMPDLRQGEKGELWKIAMSGEDLIQTLEYCITIDNNQGGWFYYFSGLNMEYSPSAQPGERIRKITDAKGKPIAPNQIYMIAVMDDSVPKKYIRSCEKTGILISKILEDFIQEKKIISPSGDNRFVVW